MAKKRPKMNLTKPPKARTGDFEQLFAPDDAPEQAAGLRLVALRVDVIEADPLQPRRAFDDETLRDLSKSIAADGLIQPIEVVQIDRNTYRIVHGERRWRASQLAGLTTIPAIVKRRDYDEVTRFVRQMVENIQREDLNDIDRAAGLVHLRELMQTELNAEAEQQGDKPWSSKATWAKVADRMGYSRQRVSQLTNLLKLPTEVQQSVQNGALSERDTRIFHNLTTRQQRALHRARIIDGVVSQAELKQVADYLKQGKTNSVEVAVRAVQTGENKAAKPTKPAPAREVENRIKQMTGALKGFPMEKGGVSAETLQALHTIQIQLDTLIAKLSK